MGNPFSARSRHEHGQDNFLCGITSNLFSSKNLTSLVWKKYNINCGDKYPLMWVAIDESTTSTVQICQSAPVLLIPMYLTRNRQLNKEFSYEGDAKSEMDFRYT